MDDDLRVERAVFRRGSVTYFWASKLFPKAVRADVARLYSFLRVVDDCVDSIPADAKRFYTLRAMWDSVKDDEKFDGTPAPSDSVNDRIIKNIVSVGRKYGFEPNWIEAFWDSMQSDLEGVSCRTLNDTLRYVYGSAEVVGLMMARLMGLPPEADQAARLQGRAMQWINFIRDISEDQSLGRCYFPADDLAVCGLDTMAFESAHTHPKAFARLLGIELARYHEWQQQAREGYPMISRRQRIAVRTAADMYDWTARYITAQPLIVLTRKVKPSPLRVCMQASINILR